MLLMEPLSFLMSITQTDAPLLSPRKIGPSLVIRQVSNNIKNHQSMIAMLDTIIKSRRFKNELSCAVQTVLVPL